MPAAPPIDEGVDRKGLRVFVERFRAHHAQRLERVRASLEPEQKVVLDALPLLIHVNHPALPGFVDYDMPAGVDRYTPDDRAVAAVRQIALSYAQERLIERTRHLQAVMLLPAAAAASPHEVWVCCRESHHEALRGKLDAIVAFAAHRGLTLKARTVDPLAMRAGASKPGGTPALELDRFYLNALWLAGRYPLWWLVPRSDELRYTQFAARIQEQRFVAQDETFDLGPVPEVPLDEWIRAGLELLERAVDDPYAALPGLMLIEARTRRHAAESIPGLLAAAYKHEVHTAKAVGPELDSELIALREIERHLTATHTEHRIAFARRVCVIGCARREVFEPLRRTWETPADRTHEYTIEAWSLKRRTEETVELTAALQHAQSVVHALIDSAARADTSTTAHLNRIAARLSSSSAEEGYIPTLHPALLKTAVKAAFETSIDVARKNGRWLVREAGTVLFEAPRSAAVATWLHLHRIAPDRVRMDDEAEHASLARVLSALRTALPIDAPRNGNTLLLINAEHVPLGLGLAKDVEIVSEWDDPLDFSGYHHNTIVSIDRIHVARGVRCVGHSGPSGIATALEHALATEVDKLHCVCVGATHRHAIEARVTDLIAEIRSAFHEDAASARFVFATGAGYTVVTRSDTTRPLFATAADDDALFALLRPELPTGRPVTLVDSRSRRLGWLRQLSELIEVGRTSLLIVDDKSPQRPRVSADMESLQRPRVSADMESLQRPRDSAGSQKSPPELTLLLACHDGSIHAFTMPERPPEQLAGELFAFFARQKLSGAMAPRIYCTTSRGLTELNVPPMHRTPSLALRVRREPGRVDIYHGTDRWSNVPVNEKVLDEIVSSLPNAARTDAGSPSLSDVAFEADSPRLPERLALKFAFERRLLERIRIPR